MLRPERVKVFQPFAVLYPGAVFSKADSFGKEVI
jgi:hypothetical protein